MTRSKLISPRALLASLLMGLSATAVAQPSSSGRIAPDRGQQQASLIFQILASELAMSQGEVGIAAATYLSLARQTQDAGAAKRATELAIEARSPQRAEEAAAIWLKNAPADQEAQGTLDLLQIMLGETEKVTRSLVNRRNAIAKESIADAAAPNTNGLRPQELRLEAFYDYVAGLVGRSVNKADGLGIFERVTEADRQRPSVIYTRAMLNEKAGQYRDMERLLRQLIAQDPGHAHAHNALGYHFADRNEQLEEAYALIERALALAPNDAHIIDSMGWIYFRRGNLEQAEKYLRLAHRQQPDAEISTHLGEVLWVRGQTGEAQSFFRAAFSVDPRNEVLQSTLKRLGIPAFAVHPR
ncbi:MAG: heme biosynthesis protein HemY [Burkholderiaceae bacterium]